MMELLIEILIEELPAIPLLNNLNSCKEKWNEILKQNRLESKFDFFYTPRRLVIIHRNFPARQEDSIISLYGPPSNIAYKEDKTPSKALLSFLSKNNIKQEHITTKIKNKKEIIYIEKVSQGIESKKLLSNMVIEWLNSLHFGKNMRWGDNTQSFIRPIRNICILLNNNLIPCNAYGVQGSNIITPHRQARIKYDSVKSNDNLRANSIDSYIHILRNNGVVLDQQERKDIIIKAFKTIEDKHNVQIEIDKELLDEVIAITEYPTVLLGRFDNKFLEIPKEVIITSMKENQRYFSIYNGTKPQNFESKTNNLYAGFIVVSNAFMGNFDLILKGNEKVLRARLEDALFFYRNDIKANMNFGSLTNIGFIDGAGNLQDKVEREVILVEKLLYAIKEQCSEASNKQKATLEIDINKDLQSIIKTLYHAKNDLLSQTVGEFPELQGIMGANFASIIGFNERECLAIREQYLPHGKDLSLPSSNFSAIINLAIKLDTIFTLFHLKKIPTGSKDPFALRRQTSAFLRICVKFNYNLKISDICNLAMNSKDYANLDSKILNEFILERIYGICNHINPSIVRAVLKLNIGIVDMFYRIYALNNYCDKIDIRSVISTFKRVANILNSTVDTKNMINAELFEESERELYNNLLVYKQQKKQIILEHNSDISPLNAQDFLHQEYIKNLVMQLELLFSLKKNLDDVFENVLINCENLKLRENRISLIQDVFNEFLEFGDMCQIAI
ncbi:glycine--tRNA ligase subunit beta [Helicobacter muridarum]|uniref:Glycine--tRNA ligase beta subunit n=2 Tax=Helicobacter muridarum TaxID=216 RepID=A0A099U0B0_9HELI|nr:glycine--tRNA ligase subunit beta [Helicobacter muridarum]TLE00892.1 glycine--tRNA ligase subunit beta [Helicobacter muridarum]STQ86666.1 glycyl-tRNA synthetase subunit beta [Helicobacter muridarum]